MTDWISGTLDDLCEVEYGTRVTRKRDGGTKYPVYGGGGATFNLDDFNREDQMIVSRFAMSEECVRFVPGKFFLNDSGLTVRTRNESKMSQDFLDQQLLARSYEIYGTARGTAQKNMDMTMFRSMELAYPDSLKEQKRIVALLDAATARVTELTACYEQARTHANNLFTSALRDALESNPEWPVKTLGDVCEFQNGYAFRSAEYVKNGHALIRIKNVQQGEIVLSDDVFVHIPKDGALDQFVLNAGDILMSLTGYLGRVGRLDETDLPAALNQRVAKVSVKSKAFLFDGFLYRVLDSQWFRNKIEVYGRGAAQQNVGTSDISKIEIPVPPLEEQKRIVARLDSLKAKTSEMVAAYDAKLTAAMNLRQSILEAAFAGDL